MNCRPDGHCSVAEQEVATVGCPEAGKVKFTHTCCHNTAGVTTADGPGHVTAGHAFHPDRSGSAGHIQLSHNRITGNFHITVSSNHCQPDLTDLTTGDLQRTGHEHYIVALTGAGLAAFNCAAADGHRTGTGVNITTVGAVFSCTVPYRTAIDIQRTCIIDVTAMGAADSGFTAFNCAAIEVHGAFVIDIAALGQGLVDAAALDNTTVHIKGNTLGYTDRTAVTGDITTDNRTAVDIQVAAGGDNATLGYIVMAIGQLNCAAVDVQGCLIADNGNNTGVDHRGLTATDHHAATGGVNDGEGGCMVDHHGSHIGLVGLAV